MTDAPLKGSFVPVWIPDLDGFPITGFCGQEGLILVEATPLQSLQRHILEILSDSMPRKKTAMVRILAQQEQPESGMPLAVAVGRALQELRKAAKITVTGQFWKLVRSSEEKPPLGSVAKLG